MTRTDRSPDWPRMMRRATAAAYLDLSVPVFERAVSGGDLPLPVVFAGKDSWCRQQIDSAIDRLLKEPVIDWRAKSPIYANHPHYSSLSETKGGSK